MKIKKLAQKENQFADEGRNIEETQGMSDFQAQTDVNESKLGKKGPVYTAEVLSLAMKAVGNSINSSYVANGSVGWVEYKGIIYEIQVSSAYYGNYPQYFKDLQARANKPEESKNKEELP